MVRYFRIISTVHAPYYSSFPRYTATRALHRTLVAGTGRMPPGWLVLTNIILFVEIHIDARLVVFDGIWREDYCSIIQVRRYFHITKQCKVTGGSRATALTCNAATAFPHRHTCGCHELIGYSHPTLQMWLVSCSQWGLAWLPSTSISRTQSHPHIHTCMSRI